MIDGVCILYVYVQLMGKEMACGGLPVPGTDCPVPNVGNIYLIWYD